MEAKCEDSEATVAGESFSCKVGESVDIKIGESTAVDGDVIDGDDCTCATDPEDTGAINGATFSLFFLASQILLVPVRY